MSPSQLQRGEFSEGLESVVTDLKKKTATDASNSVDATEDESMVRDTVVPQRGLFRISIAAFTIWICFLAYLAFVAPMMQN